MDRRTALNAMGISVASLASGTAARSAARAENSADTAHAHEAHDADLGPLRRVHLYLCAFHVAKKDPKLVFSAHHYCMPVNDQVHQCVIFDSTGEDARILGVEYIISDELYRKLPKTEKKYYHPHAYEVTSGLLVAPNMTAEAEDKLMAGIVMTWGKTWHTWPDPKQPLPMGEPLLMWAATADGQISPDLLAQRDEELKISTDKIRQRREFIGPVPQIPAPKSLDEIGRQWTADGPDEPRRK